jgi:hypothetical protein
MGLVAKIWPVYSWDDSPPIFAMMVSLEMALEELNLHITEAELNRALKDCGIAVTRDDAGKRLQAEIKAFYDARRDRRIKKWV